MYVHLMCVLSYSVFSYIFYLHLIKLCVCFSYLRKLQFKLVETPIFFFLLTKIVFSLQVKK